MPIETSATKPSPNGPPDRFEREATATLRELRRTTADLLASCKGVDRAIEVSARLGLERSLAWKVWRMAQGSSPCPSVAHIPGRQGFRQLLDAASRAGVDAPVIAAAESAYANFEQLMVAYAGDRPSAESLLGALSPEGRTRHDTALRRDAFRANATLLGVQAAAMYQLDVLIPHPGGLPPEVLRIRGHYGLRRNRPNVPWILTRSTLVGEDGPSGELRRVPLVRGDAASEPVPDSPGPMLIERFSSHPAPPVRRRVIGGVTVEDELLPGPVGQVNAVNIVTGERVIRFTRPASELDALTMVVNTPCERLCYDLIAPESLLLAPPTLRVHSTVQVEHPYLRGPDFSTIPVTETIEDLGPALRAGSAAEIPEQSALIRWTLGHAGDRLTEPRLWRVRMRFPPLPSCLAASYQIHEPAGEHRSSAPPIAPR